MNNIFNSDGMFLVGLSTSICVGFYYLYLHIERKTSEHDDSDHGTHENNGSSEEDFQNTNLEITVVDNEVRKTTSKTKIIVILSYGDAPSTHEIEKGFIKNIIHHGSYPYAIQRLNAQQNEENLLTLIETIKNRALKEKSIDLVFTTSSLCTTTLKKHLPKNHSIPIVFGGVKNPVALNLVESLEKPGGMITGVTSINRCYEQQMALLLKMKPSIKSALLVFDPKQNGGFVIEEQMLISEYLKKQNVKIFKTPIQSTHDIKKALKPFMKKVDVVIGLRDITFMEGIKNIVSLCNKHSVTAFTSDLPSVYEGAALGFGISEQQYGRQAAFIALKILEHDCSPQFIPVKVVGEKGTLLLNKKTMKQQGLHPDEKTLIQIDHREIM